MIDLRPPERRSREPLVVRYVRTTAGFEGLERHWEQLHADAPAANIFNGWSWLSTWWRLHGHGRVLTVLVATRGGVMIGVLPLYTESVKHLGLSVRMLRLLGDGGSALPEDLGPLIATAHAAEVAAALARAVLRVRNFDVAQLSSIDPRSPFAAALVGEAEAAQLRCSVQTPGVSVFRPTIGAAAFRADELYLRRSKSKLRSLAKRLLPSPSMQRNY